MNLIVEQLQTQLDGMELEVRSLKLLARTMVTIVRGSLTELRDENGNITPEAAALLLDKLDKLAESIG